MFTYPILNSASPYPNPVIEGVVYSEDNTNGDTFTVNLPASIVADELILIVIMCDHYNDPNMSAPAGWVKESETNTSGGVTGSSVIVFSKVAEGGETSVVINNASSSPRRVSAAAYRISGASLATPVNAVGITHFGFTDTHVMPSALTTTYNCLVITALAKDENSTDLTFAGSGTGWTITDLANTNVFIGAAVGVYNNPSTPGATPQPTIISSGSGTADSHGATIAISPINYLEVKPSAPANFTATAYDYQTIDLAWDLASNVARYSIERSLTGIDSWSEIATPYKNQSSYSDTGLDPETTYYYRIRAYNDTDWSNYSEDNDTTLALLLPVIVDSSTASAGSTTTSLNITVPAAVQAGDLIIIFMGQDNTGSSPDHTISGFTQIGTEVISSGNADISAFYKVADGTEGVVTCQSTVSRRMAAVCILISDADVAGTPINANSGNTTFGTVQTVTGITTTVDNCLVLAAVSLDGSGGVTWNITTADWITHAVTTASNFHHFCWGELEQVTAGATGNVVFDNSNNDGGAGIILAIAPG